jgi:molecular chaperone GrpE
MNNKNPKKQNRENEIEHDDIEFEDEIVEESSVQEKMKKLRAELKKAKEESREYLTGWQKERAAFANYKSDEEKKRQDRLLAMKTNLVADFFPVLDSFDMAFNNKEAWEKVDSAWRSGVEYIHSQFMNTLESYGVSVIDEVGVEFDPMIHEPVEQIEVTDASQDNTVISIIQKGYRAGDLVLRPAKVHTGVYKS